MIVISRFQETLSIASSRRRAITFLINLDPERQDGYKICNDVYDFECRRLYTRTVDAIRFHASEFNRDPLASQHLSLGIRSAA